jgi:hypothetical protein
MTNCKEDPNEYIAWIKKTKSGYYRGILSYLADVGEPDGDRSLLTTHESRLYDADDLPLLVEEVESMSRHNIKINIVPRTGEAIMWESMFKESA